MRRRPKRSMVQTFKLFKSSPKEKRPCMLQRPWCFWSRALSVKKTCLWHVFSEKASLRRRPKRSMVQTFKLFKSSPKEKRPCMLQRPWCFWSRGLDLNQRPPGYEPGELTRLLHPAIYLVPIGIINYSIVRLLCKKFLFCVFKTQ